MEEIENIVKSLKESIEELKGKNEEIESKLEKECKSNIVYKSMLYELKPKKTYYDEILKCRTEVSIKTIAKDYGYKKKELMEYLEKRGFLIRKGNLWYVNTYYAVLGYTKTQIKTSEEIGEYGTIIKTNILFTQKGRIFLYEYLKEDKILPKVELKVY